MTTNTENTQDITDKCIICNSNDFTLTRQSSDPEGYSHKVFKYYECSQCGLVSLRPQPSIEELSKHYPDEYYGSDQDKKSAKFVGPVEYFINIFRGFKAKKLLKFKKSGSILDIGCGKGHILSIMESKGFTVTGTEFSENSASYGRNKFGLKILATDMLDADFDDDSFDIITLWHVFEHLTSPDLALEKIRKFLKPDGVLLIAVPNYGSLQSRLSQSKWFQLDPPRHLYHFTPDTLEALLNKSGFKVINKNYSSLEFNYFDMVQSLYNILGVRKNFLYNLLRGNKFLEKNPLRNVLDYLLTVIYAPVVFPLGFLLTFFPNRTKLGGNIEFVSRLQP